MSGSKKGRSRIGPMSLVLESLVRRRGLGRRRPGEIVSSAIESVLETETDGRGGRRGRDGGGVFGASVSRKAARGRRRGSWDSVSIIVATMMAEAGKSAAIGDEDSDGDDKGVVASRKTPGKLSILSLQ
jgi:hypothetical protein